MGLFKFACSLFPCCVPIAIPRGNFVLRQVAGCSAVAYWVQQSRAFGLIYYSVRSIEAARDCYELVALNGARSNTLTGQAPGSHPPGRPVTTTSSRPWFASSRAAENLEGGRVEPVHILGHHQARTAAQTGQHIVLSRFADQLVELAALGGLGPRPREKLSGRMSRGSCSSRRRS